MYAVGRPPDTTELIVPLRDNPALRTLARRHPVLRASARRIAQLTRPAGKGLWVEPGHFYSPIPDMKDLLAREADIWQRDPANIPGVDLRVGQQRQLLRELEAPASEVALFEDEPSARAAGRRYWMDNDNYAHGDGTFLTLMLKHFRPTRFLELGCGYSSACTLDAREFELNGRLQVTFSDPYPQLLRSLMHPGDEESASLLDLGTQQIATVGTAQRLQEGDVLFVDSTHVARTGSDVNALFFEILPSLAPGVIVHLHDVFPSFEYPKDWVLEGRAWTEQYLLRAFLQYNSEFEILLWPGMMLALDPDYILARFPALRRNPGGAIWLRRRR